MCTLLLTKSVCFPQVLELPNAEGPKVFSYDEEWLATLRTTHSLLSLDRRKVSLPGEIQPWPLADCLPFSHCDSAPTTYSWEIPFER